MTGRDEHDQETDAEVAARLGYPDIESYRRARWAEVQAATEYLGGK